MDIVEILQSHPLNGIAILIALAVIAWSFVIVRKSRSRYDRILIGGVGMIAVFQGMRLLIGASYDDLVNLFVTAICPASLWALTHLSRTHRTTEFALRLAEGNQSLPLKANISLLAAEDVSRTVLDAAPMPMFAVGLDGNVNCWNRAAEKALGWSREEVLGQKLPNLLLYPGDPMDGQSAALRVVRKDGSALDHTVSSVPLRDAKGTVNGILTILSS